DAPGVLHHVMIRGIERRNIFRSKKAREDFLQRLGQLIPETGTHCYGWAFLSNHAHFLFRTADVPLSILMRRLLTGYVVGFNRRHNRHGQLFQNRFKSIVCQDNLYLKELVCYIHLNPLRAGLVADLEKLDKYSYCGHSALMGHVERKWQKTEDVLMAFGKDTQAARETYRTFVEQGIDQGRREELVGGGLVRSLGGWSEVKKGQSHGMSDERILGDADFVDSVLSQADETLNRHYKLKALGYDINRVVERAAGIYQMDTDEIYTPGRQGLKVNAKSLVCFWAVRELGFSLTELARIFEMSSAGISYAVKRGEKLVKDNNFKLII
ncbi:MAG: transposase, partial [Thermodesulfobacteriota bacterium]|nr:transposase [Thermodesulfobacteriota bacterium]